MYLRTQKVCVWYYRDLRGPFPNAETDSAGQAPTCLSDKFGERLLEVDCNSSWVHDVAWSLNGSKLAACSHNCTVFVVDGLDVNVPESFTQAASDVATVTLTTLPLKSILFVSER
jgi:hypothetical protein